MFAAVAAATGAACGFAVMALFYTTMRQPANNLYKHFSLGMRHSKVRHCVKTFWPGHVAIQFLFKLEIEVELYTRIMIIIWNLCGKSHSQCMNRTILTIWNESDRIESKTKKERGREKEQTTEIR